MAMSWVVRLQKLRSAYEREGGQKVKEGEAVSPVMEGHSAREVVEMMIVSKVNYWNRRLKEGSRKD